MNGKSAAATSVVAPMAIALVLLGAVPAQAHEEINPATIPTGKPVFLSLSAANEKGVDLTKLTLRAPAGAPFGEATRQPPGWAADRTGAVITWSGGRLAPHGFDQWGFETDGADQPGPLRYDVTMGFADGSSQDATVEVTAVAGGAVPTTAAVTPSSGASVPTTLPTTATKASGGNGGDDDLATAALVVAIAAAALAVLGVGLGLRPRRSTGSGPAPGSGAAADRGAPDQTQEGQEW